ncbi:hypothetical protein SAMN02745126_01651 [Enhydrobacter aerosaccus]|uniref:Uncharacterized protein n=1 Tax=Enhydrobacter aerosaccus TaxID=225324 RepID=A0A1T4LPI8_9HYPH|nr:hypothetical protein [Enhydrobacter aerosaccus]SJZ56642.1 hypothetical protein SAMN02745126_01651 [Enhydrobacter aerosaccus]
MKKKWIALAAVVIVAAGAAALPVGQRFAASRIKAEIERDGTATVETVEVGLLDRRVTLINLKTHAFGEVVVHRAQVSGLSVPFSDLLEGRTPLSDFRPGDPLRAERLEVTEARVVDPATGASLAVDALTVEGLDLVRYDGAVTGPYRLAILMARIASALSVRRIEEKKVVYTVAVSGDTVELEKLSIDRVDRGKIGAIAIDGVDATPKNANEASFKIAEVNAKDIGLGRMLPRLSDASWVLGRPLGRLEIGSFRVAGFGGVLLSQYGVSLGAISLETNRQSVDSVASHLRIEGLGVRPGSNAEAARLGVLLGALGLRELALGFDCSGEERRAKRELGITDCRLTIADLADVSLAAGLVNADDAFWRALDDGNPLGIGGSSIALGSARLSIVDKGVIERSVRALAAATRQLPSAARAKLAQDIRSYQPPDVLITEDLTKLLDTAARFIEQGGTLQVDARPDPPLGLAALGRLSSPGPDLVSLLGLSATLSR